jgi:hypothetical protein
MKKVFFELGSKLGAAKLRLFFLPLVAAIMLSMSMISFATVSDFDYRNVDVCQIGTTRAFDLDTGAYFNTSNAAADVEFFQTGSSCVFRTANGATAAQVGRFFYNGTPDDNFGFDCNNVILRAGDFNAQGYNDAVGIYNSSNTEFCINTTLGYHVLFKGILGESEVFQGENNFTSTVQDDTTWIFNNTALRPSNLPNLTVNYSEIYMSSGGSIANAGKGIDLDTGVMYISSSGSQLNAVDFTIGQIGSTVCASVRDGASFNKETNVPALFIQSIDCDYHLTTANGVCAEGDYVNASIGGYCIKSSDNKTYLFGSIVKPAPSNPLTLTMDAFQMPIGFGYFTTGYANASNFTSLWFDFETPRMELFYFGGADFRYDAGSLLVPKNDLVPYSTASLLKTDGSPDNNLNRANCGYLWDYSATIRNPNVQGYDTFCFNQSSQHNGLQYFGAIKVIRSTYINNVSKFDFYWALQRDDFNVFTTVSTNPKPPVVNRSLDIYYTSSKALTTEGRVREITSGSYSPFFTLNGSSVLQNSHTITVPAFYLENEGSFEFLPSGRDVNNVTYSGLQGIDSFYFSTTFGNLTAPYETPNYADALIILPLDENGFSIAADCNFIFDNGTSQTGFNPPDPSDRYYIPSRGETVWANVIHTVNIGEVVEVQCKYSDQIGYDQNITINTLPKIVEATIDRFDYCIFVTNVTSEIACASTINGSTIAWYCYYDSNSCAAYSGTTCSRWGRWYGYDCTSCGAVPSGYTCNSTNRILGNASSTPTDLLCYGLNGLLNVNCNSALSFVALIITMIITAAIGILSKSGVIGGIIFETSLITFFFIGWLPIWVALVLGVLAALLIAKFISDSIMPQAR